VTSSGWQKGLKVTGGGTGIVSHAGLALVRTLADNTGLTAGLSQALATGRLLAHDRGRVRLSRVHDSRYRLPEIFWLFAAEWSVEAGEVEAAGVAVAHCAFRSVTEAAAHLTGPAGQGSGWRGWTPIRPACGGLPGTQPKTRQDRRGSQGADDTRRDARRDRNAAACRGGRSSRPAGARSAPGDSWPVRRHRGRIDA
jgi:hypothetical protein